MTLGLGDRRCHRWGLPPFCSPHSHPVTAQSLQAQPRGRKPGSAPAYKPPCAEPGPVRSGVGGTTPVPSRLGCGLVGAAKCELSQVAWVLAC